jgi:hypothetical protein
VVWALFDASTCDVIGAAVVQSSPAGTGSFHRFPAVETAVYFQPSRVAGLQHRRGDDLRPADSTYARVVATICVRRTICFQGHYLGKRWMKSTPTGRTILWAVLRILKEQIRSGCVLRNESIRALPAR